MIRTSFVRRFHRLHRKVSLNLKREGKEKERLFTSERLWMKHEDGVFCAPTISFSKRKVQIVATLRSI